MTLQSGAQTLLETGQYRFVDSEFEGKMALMAKDGTKPICLINSGDALSIEKIKKGIIPSDFLSGQIEIYPPGVDATIEDNIAAVLSFADIAMGELKCEKLSLGDLFFLIGMLMLSLSQFEREALGDAAIFDRQTLAEQVKQIFTLAIDVAKKQYDAAKKQSIAEMVMAGVNILGSAISLGCSIKAAIKLGKAAPNNDGASAGEADKNPSLSEKEIEQIQREAQSLNTMGQAFQQLSSAIGQLIKGGSDFNVAGIKFEADKMNATIEGLRQFLQVIQSKISTETQAYRDTSQQMQQTVEFVKKMADMVFNIIHEVASHI